MGNLPASISGADLAHPRDEVKATTPLADVIPIDVMTAHLAPPLSLHPVVVASLRPHAHRVVPGGLARPVGAPFDRTAEASVAIEIAEAA